jgi:hypothetical protein
MAGVAQRPQWVERRPERLMSGTGGKRTLTNGLFR